MPPVETTLTPYFCSQPDCGRPLGTIGDLWVHVIDGNGWYRNCEGSPLQATPPKLPVAHFQHGKGVESWHIMLDHVEYVAWFHNDERGYTVWRTAVMARSVVATVYVSDQPHDPASFLEQLPPIVAFWLRDAIYPF